MGNYKNTIINKPKKFATTHNKKKQKMKPPIAIYKEGDKVKLNVPQIKQHFAWDNFRPDYKEFVEQNEGRVFSVQFDKVSANSIVKNVMVCLQEDDSDAKWRFHQEDLIRVEE